MLPVFVLAFQSALVPPMPPQSKAESPAMQAAASLQASTAAAPAALRTRAERTAYRETGLYAEAVDFYRALEKSSPYARLQQIGTSGEGRPLYVLIASRDKAFTPAAARKTGKPVILLQNGIHAGENGGKDAAMMLLRDVLVTRRRAAWLDDVILLSIPVFNADGHEHTSPYNRINENGPDRMGFRVTSRRLNLNRDYLKADTPEMRAWLRLYAAWLPELLIDNHVTDGSDNQYDVTIASHTEQDIAPPMGSWVKTRYLPVLLRELESLGHVPGFYIEGRGRDGQSLAVMTASPRYSTGYAAARNRAALLVETHSLKSFRTRVWSHYDIMSVSIQLAAGSAAALRQSALDSDRFQSSVRPGDRVFLEGSPGAQGEPYTLKMLEAEQIPSPVSGATVTRYTDRPRNQAVTLVRSLQEKFAPAAPLGYIVPRQWQEVIDLLRLHGVQMEDLAQAREAEFDTYRFENVRFAAMPFEGRFQVSSFQTKPVRETRVFPAGSVFVPVAQPAGKLAMQILEPQAPDSALRWGFFQSIFEQKEYFSEYVFEPYAREMLNQNSMLKSEFDARLAADPAFAKNPRARLLWLYQRSPYFEAGKDAYPVVRVLQR